MQSTIIRAIFKGREVVLVSQPDRTERPRGLVSFTKSIAWGVLADTPGREIVMGAVTQPWEANVVFRSLPADPFLAFDEPGYVKIAHQRYVRRPHIVFALYGRYRYPSIRNDGCAIVLSVVGLNA